MVIQGILSSQHQAAGLVLEEDTEFVYIKLNSQIVQIYTHAVTHRTLLRELNKLAGLSKQIKHNITVTSAMVKNLCPGLN